MPLLTDPIDRLRLSPLALPGLWRLDFRSTHAGRHQLYANGELLTTTARADERHFLVAERAFCQELCVVAVDETRADADLGDDLPEPAREIPWIYRRRLRRRLEHAPGSRWLLRHDAATSRADATPAWSRDVWPDYLPHWGFGQGRFGAGGFGVDGDLAPGFGAAEFGLGPFGFGGEVVEIELPVDSEGPHLAELTVADADGRESAPVADAFFAAPPPAPADALTAASYDPRHRNTDPPHRRRSPTVSEYHPADNDLNALSGTSDPDQGVPFPAVYESPYYTSFYRMLRSLLNVARRAGDLRVYKDGALTFGMRAGQFLDGSTLRTIDPAVEQALTDDATNVVYLTADGTLTVDIDAFPDPADTPHVRLATITTAGGDYDLDDIEDQRGTALVGLAHGLSAATVNALNGLAPQLAVTGADDADGTGSATIQLRDAAGEALAAVARIRVWISSADMGAPSAVTDFSVTTGTQLAERTADADYEVLTDETGLAIMNVDNGGAGTVYVMADVGGRIASEQIDITA